MRANKTEDFLSILKDRQADWATKAGVLKILIHFVGDLYQPLHCEDDDDKGENAAGDESRSGVGVRAASGAAPEGESQTQTRAVPI